MTNEHEAGLYECIDIDGYLASEEANRIFVRDYFTSITSNGSQKYYVEIQGVRWDCGEVECDIVISADEWKYFKKVTSQDTPHTKPKLEDYEVDYKQKYEELLAKVKGILDDY